MICEKCGKELSDDANMCTSCGWKTPNWKSEKERGDSRNKSIYIALAGIAIIFVLWLVLISHVFS